MRAAFSHDQNGSGYLDYTELRNALAYMGYDVDKETTCELLRAYDDYPDSKLELAEFGQLVNDLNRAEEEAAEAADEEEAWEEDDDGSPEAAAARRVARARRTQGAAAAAGGGGGEARMGAVWQLPPGGRRRVSAAAVRRRPLRCRVPYAHALGDAQAGSHRLPRQRAVPLRGRGDQGPVLAAWRHR